MRPAGKARRPRILGIFEGGATQPGGMQRQPNAKLFRGQHTRVEIGSLIRASAVEVSVMTVSMRARDASIRSSCVCNCWRQRLRNR
jgi:hypothetical protein